MLVALSAEPLLASMMTVPVEVAVLPAVSVAVGLTPLPIDLLHSNEFDPAIL